MSTGERFWCWLYLISAVIILLVVTACKEKGNILEPDKVRLQLKWEHQAQFAGYYAAVSKGYYTQENLEVELLPGGVNIDQVERVRSGEADFGVVPAETLLLKNDKPQKLIAIAVIYQRNPTVFVSRAGSNILRPEDLVGKTIAVGDMESGGFLEGILQLRALFKKRNLDIQAITTIPYDPLYTEFIAGRVDVTPAYLVGGVIKLRQKGIDLNLIWPGDYGIRFYSDTLVAADSFISDHPDIVLRFLRATLKGWQYCIMNQNDAVDITMQYAAIKDRGLQQSMMDAQNPLVHTGAHHIGWMQPEIWLGMEQLFVEQGDLKIPVGSSESIYTMRFLNEIYQGTGL